MIYDPKFFQYTLYFVITFLKVLIDAIFGEQIDAVILFNFKLLKQYSSIILIASEANPFFKNFSHQ